MATHLIYQHPSDNLMVAAATVVTLTTGTADSAYPLTNLYDLKPDKPFQITAAEAFEIVVDFGSAMTLGVLALFSSNLDAALNVRVQRNATDSWGAPSVDVVLTIPTKREDNKPVDPWVDLSTGAGSGSYRYLRLKVPANSVIPAIGEMWIGGTLRELPDLNIQHPYEDTETHPRVEFKTNASVPRAYDHGVTTRSLRMDYRATVAGLAAVRSWWRSTFGGSRKVVVILDPTANDARLMMFVADPFARTHISPFLNDLRLDLDEVSGGVVNWT